MKDRRFSYLADLALVAVVIVIAVFVLRGRGGGDASIAVAAADWRVLSSGGHSQGSIEADVVLVEFLDYECPFCARAEPVIAGLLRNYPGRIRLVRWHFPLPQHADAVRAAIAVECAAEEGKYEAMHHRLFEQSNLSGLRYAALAVSLGADSSVFETCLSRPEIQDRVRAEHARGQELGITGTPAFILNGRWIGAVDPVVLRAMVLAAMD